MKNMNNRYWLFKRGEYYYSQDSLTGKQESLRTKDQQDAERLRRAKSDAANEPAKNMALAKVYLSAADPVLIKRTWTVVMSELASHGRATTQTRCQREMRSVHFDKIRHKPLVATTADDLLAVLRVGTTSTNHYLRRLHNLAVGLGWLSWPLLAPRLWPTIKSKSKRAITQAEHEQIVATESNRERKLFYELLWETGASQTDGATLTAENINWDQMTIRYKRRKTGEEATLSIGQRLKTILRQLPDQGALFPNWRGKKDTDRASEFRRRCRILGIVGVSLHSYRYAWAQRAKALGYPERWAQAALGHDSRAVHEAYARGGEVICPSLQNYEDKVVRANFHQTAGDVRKAG